MHGCTTGATAGQTTNAPRLLISVPERNNSLKCHLQIVLLGLGVLCMWFCIVPKIGANNMGYFYVLILK